MFSYFHSSLSLNNSLQPIDIAITTPTNSTWNATWQAKKIGNIVIATGYFTLNHTGGQGSGNKWSTTAIGINPSISIFALSSCGTDYPVSIEWQNDGKINITNRGSKTIPNGSTFQTTFCVPLSY